MKDVQLERINEKPSFDLMDFMNLNKEKRLDGPIAERLEKLWAEWVGQLSVYKILCGKISYLAVWLPETVENKIDEIWDSSPSEGFLANSLAQFICMQVVSDSIPQVEISGCAPAPKPTESLRKTLAGIGLKYRSDIAVLDRRFAVVTHFPFRGGCEICFLQPQCPKGNGSGEEAGTVVLPGYEHPGSNE